MLIDTPVETYSLKGRDILVKRDDLVGDGNVLPPWGKLIGIEALLDKLDPNIPLIHLAVNGSWSGWALSHLCKKRGIKFIYAYPPSESYSQFVLDKAKENDCEFYELKPNMMKILYYQVKRYADDNDLQILPYAFDDILYRQTLSARALKVFAEHSIDHLVISAGSGVTSSGVVQGYLDSDFLTTKKTHIITVSNASTIEARYKSYGFTPSLLNIEKSTYRFDNMMTDYDVPFPCNGTWDKKAWWWLENTIELLEGDVLFWNIGGRISEMEHSVAPYQLY